MERPTDSTAPEETSPPSSARGDGGPEALTFAVLWCPEEPWRIGEIGLLPAVRGSASLVLGRGTGESGDPGPRILLARVTRRGVEAALPIGLSRISRVQALVEIAPSEDALIVQNVGRAKLFSNGAPVQRAVTREGDVLQFGRQLLLLCVRRTGKVSVPGDVYPEHTFGRPDAFGIVGESPGVWRMRWQIAFVAGRRGHVLVHGASGSGKELVAHAIHALSAERGKAVVARNAATLPPGLVDAELFGNARNYPNAGMTERAGLIGEADGSTLYLDEFAELSETSQAHFLRVLDHGEYQRLGESVARRSTFRLVAATNRPLGVIKEDLLARIPFRFELPDLNARREDIPLLLVHLLRTFATTDRALSAWLFPDGDVARLPNVSSTLVRALVQRTYRTNVRELEGLLWEAIQQSDGRELKAPAAWAPDDASSSDSLQPASPSDPPDAALTKDRIRAELDRHNGELEATWKGLGLKNRHQLRRLLAKYGIEVRKRV